MEFCARLSRATGRTYRLPTEAEWEYACRGGTTTTFYFGDTITPELVNYDGDLPYGSAAKGTFRGTTTPAGSVGYPNAFGLYDMLGNVREWCMDYWHESYNGAPADGSSWESGGDASLRVLRGGSFVFGPANNCRSASRYRSFPENRHSYVIGFRVVASARTQSVEASKVREAPPAPPGMAYVPGNEFTMGNDAGADSERPQHRVTVTPFFIDIYEVTCEEYDKFIRATSRQPPATWADGHYPSGWERRPVTGVDWDDASAYAEWAGKRLPTEQEWEFAARGSDGRLYPWGSECKDGSANAGPTSLGHLGNVGTSPAGVSPFGALDMVGNAWEWTASDFVAYPGGRLPGQATGMLKVIRGGCFLSRPDQATSTIRVGWPARGGNEYDNTGFRCAKNPPVTSQ